MKLLKISSYKKQSKSAQALREGVINSRLVAPDSVTYTPKQRHIILNWGNSSPFTWDDNQAGLVLNYPSNVKRAINKLLAFYSFKENNVSHVEFTEDKDIAQSWLKDGEVVCRKLLSSYEGKGIVVASTPEELVNAPLYTRYKKKKAEYRVHVFDGKVIDIQQKRKKKDVEINNQIRNTAGGWVFCRENLDPPTDLLSTSISAVAALGLDFGAVDIIYNQKENKCYVLEINTAPGIEGTTVTKYINAIGECLNGNH